MPEVATATPVAAATSTVKYPADPGVSGATPDTSPEETYAAWRAALALPSVRGLVVGRTLLYPQDDDVAAAVDTAASMVR